VVRPAAVYGTVLRDMPASMFDNADLPMVKCLTNNSLFVEVMVIGSFVPTG
jgi:hypothetical protein